jgi:hypothetical protein
MHSDRVLSEADFEGVSAGQLLEVVTAVTMLLSLPQAAADRVDGLAVLTGQGEQWRLTEAIRRWEANPALRCLLVANGNPAEETYVEITLDYLGGLGLRRIDGVEVQAEPAPNTGLQAAWIADRIDALEITSLALAVSPYHLLRAYLTVLKAVRERGILLPLIPVPVPVPPDTPVPETGATAYDLVPGEVKRILAYVEQDWVASPKELRQYLQWLWTNHPSLVGAPAPERREFPR